MRDRHSDPSPRGHFLYKDGEMVPVNDDGTPLRVPDGVFRPAAPAPMGPTRLAEWLMVDVRIARAVPPESRLWRVCEALGAAGACGVIEATLVVDILEASPRDRPLLLDPASWPTLA